MTRDQSIYDAAIANGCSPKFAEALACRRIAAGLSTDDQWWRGNQHFSQIMGEKYANDVRRRLAAQGVRMGSRDDYVPQLARYRGDPNALISGHGARSQLRKAAARMSDWQRRQDERPAVALAEDIIQEKIDAIAAEHPEVKRWGRKAKQKLRQEIVSKHAMNPSLAKGV